MDSVKLARTAGILLVEDSPSDVRLIREALRDSQLAPQLTVAHDGAEAVSILQRSKTVPESLPDLIILDLNLPRKSGREVLEEIKADHALRHIPVIVMTSSKDEDEISAIYHLNANCYIQKPSDLFEYERVVRAIEDFWLMTVMLPDCYSYSNSGAASPGRQPLQ
jgi:two-component system, chemotaxis family, response regulator Rcp1